MACIALWRGDLAAARHWQQTYDVQTPERLSYANEFQSLALARLLIAEGRLNSTTPFYGDALTLLGRIEDTAVSSGRFGRAMEAKLLQALAHDAKGDTVTATQFLEQALILAELEGFIRTFVDEGEPMAVLLGRVEQRPFVTQLLTNFPTTAGCTPHHATS